MKSILLAVVTMAMAGTACAGPSSRVADWDAAVPPEASSLERSFVRMLARANDPPLALTLLGEPDDVEVLVAKALAGDATCALRPTSRDSQR